MKGLRELVAEADASKKALGHFNISDTEGLWGIFNAARRLNLPVLIGTSEGERDFLGVVQAVALVRSLREEFDYPIFLSADHTYSFERVKEVVDAGYDAVIFDGAQLPFEDNIARTRECVDYVRKTRPEVLVEGELGYIGTSSKLLDAIPPGAATTPELLTKPDDIKRFVLETGIDCVAPAVGSLHGMLRIGTNPALDIGRISELRAAAAVPLVLHGGSGTSEEDFRRAIRAGISIIHINTEIRLAYRTSVQLYLQANPDEVAPYKFMKSAVQEIERVVEARLRLFNNI